MAPPPVPPKPVAQTVSYPVFFRFAAGGQAAIGLSPTVTPGLFASVGFRYRRFELYGEGRFDAASAVEVTLGKVWVRPIAAFILPCVASPWGLSACAQLGAGALQVEGQVSFGNKDTTPLLFAGLRLRVQLLFRSVGCRIGNSSVSSSSSNPSDGLCRRGADLGDFAGSGRLGFRSHRAVLTILFSRPQYSKWC